MKRTRARCARPIGNVHCPDGERAESVILQLEEPLRIVEGVGPSADSDWLEGWEHLLTTASKGIGEKGAKLVIISLGEPRLALPSASGGWPSMVDRAQSWLTTCVSQQQPIPSTV
jgi:hypothetical protein